MSLYKNVVSIICLHGLLSGPKTPTFDKAAADTAEDMAQTSYVLAEEMEKRAEGFWKILARMAYLICLAMVVAGVLVFMWKQ